jgi:tRNA threonylcarbamoyladenosine biosynthesis protein TsaE
MKLVAKHCIKSFEDLEAFVALLANEIEGGKTLGLCGQLGAGKTTFVRYLMRQLESPDSVSSPTYVLEQEYRTVKGFNVEHWDLYRLGSAPMELFEQPGANTLRIVEWIDKFEELKQLAEIVIIIELSGTLDEQHRSLSIMRQS